MITPATRIAVNLVLLAMMISLWLARVYVVWTRLRTMLRAQWFNELFLLLIVILATASSITNVYIILKVADARSHPTKATNPKLGIPLDLATVQAKIAFFQMIAYTIIIWLIKGSFLVIYFNIRANLSKKLKWTLYIVTGIVTMAFIAILAANLLKCTPVWRNWTLGPQYCAAAANLEMPIKTSAISIFVDICLIIIPLFILRGLQLGRRERIAMAFLFFIGGLCVLAAVIRLVFLILMWNINTKDLSQQLRLADYSAALFMISAVEEVISFIAACLPAMRVLLRRAKENSSQGYSSRSGRSYGMRTPRGVLPEVKRGKRNVYGIETGDFENSQTELNDLSPTTELNDRSPTTELNDRSATTELDDLPPTAK